MGFGVILLTTAVGRRVPIRSSCIVIKWRWSTADKGKVQSWTVCSSSLFQVVLESD